MKKNETNINVNNLTQRLDHSVPDPEMTNSINRAAANELEMLSAALFELLPDKSLSPLERIERLSRSVENRQPDLNQLKPATKKLQELKDRINLLVEGEGSAHEKVMKMLNKLDDMVSDEQAKLPVIKKLELLGDPRGNIEPEN